MIITGKNSMKSPRVKRREGDTVMAPIPHTIHRSPEKWAFYEENHPISWVSRLKCWAVTCPDAIAEVFRDDRFEVLDFQALNDKLSGPLNEKLDHSSRLFRDIPLALTGADHRAARRRYAQAISARTGAALEAARDVIAQALNDRVGTADTIDLSGDVLKPGITALMRVLSGLAHEFDAADPGLPQMFAPYVPLKTRRAMNGCIRDAIEQRPSGCDEAAAYEQLGIWTVGSDSIFATCAVALKRELEVADGRSLKDHAWSEEFLVTGLPFVDRVATESFPFHGADIQAGDTVRLYLDVFEKAERQQEHFFGTGPHVCLGKALSKKLWAIIVAEFQRHDVAMTLKRIELRTPDFLFNAIETMEVEIDRF